MSRPMEAKTPELLTLEEQDILQEVMNIGFGSAAADLASFIDIHVILSVPTVRILKTSGLIEYIRTEVVEYQNVSIIEQNFWSKFRGVALLVFSAGSGKELLSIVGKREDSPFESDPIGMLEKEILMEVGNILVGACVGKVSELLGDYVSYSPPRVLIGNLAQTDVTMNMFNPEDVVIVLKTVFHFSDRHVNGYLFLIASYESVDWLKQGLRTFMGQYE